MESNWRFNVWEQSPDIINVGVKTLLLARVVEFPIEGLWIANGIDRDHIPAYLPNPFTGQLSFSGTIGRPLGNPHFPYGIEVEPD